MGRLRAIAVRMITRIAVAVDQIGGERDISDGRPVLRRIRGPVLAGSGVDQLQTVDITGSQTGNGDAATDLGIVTDDELLGAIGKNDFHIVGKGSTLTVEREGKSGVAW